MNNHTIKINNNNLNKIIIIKIINNQTIKINNKIVQTIHKDHNKIKFNLHNNKNYKIKF